MLPPQLRKLLMTFATMIFGVGLALVAFGCWWTIFADVALAGVVAVAVGAYSAIYALVGSY